MLLRRDSIHVGQSGFLIPRHGGRQSEPESGSAKARGDPGVPQDTVHLSSQAKAATGDVDHDGDSH